MSAKATLTESSIKKLTEKHRNVDHLVAALTEDPYLKSGSRVFVKGSMGQTNVMGVFKEESNGWAKVKKEDGTELWVMYHQCFPEDVGT